MGNTELKVIKWRCLLQLLMIGAALRVSGAISITWKPCPASEQVISSNLKDCANIPMPLDPVNDPTGASKGTINIFVRRSYTGSSPTTKAIFGINGGPGKFLNN
jgi:hypothetical protein